MNTTEVETGERVVIAPWSLETTATRGVFSLGDRANNLQVPLSTGVSLSARFPWITLAGCFFVKNGETRRLGDGRYADNSGIATAIDVITGLKGRSGFKLIVIALVNEPDTMADSPSRFFSELASPILALDSTRSARARLAVEQAQVYPNGSHCSADDGNGVGCAFRKIVLSKGDVRVPPGWVSSTHSRQAIECSFDLMDRCGATADSRSDEEKCAVIVRDQNKQLIEQIGEELREAFAKTDGYILQEGGMHELGHEQ